MKIKEFVEKEKISSNLLWAKKFSDVHIPSDEPFKGETLCGSPMLGNNYASVAIEENRNVCATCLGHYKFGEPVTAWGDMQKEPEKDPKFEQLCVWEATTLGDDTPEMFEKNLLEKGFRVKFAEIVQTGPTIKNGQPVPGTGGRNDLFFYIHTDDIGRFSVWRLSFGIRWWEDVIANGGLPLYPDHFIKKYPRTWS